MNRRNFLKTTGGLIAFPTIVPNAVFSQHAPNNRINMGFIGVGSMGSGHLRSFLGYDDVQVVAVCDVQAAHRDQAKQMVDKWYGNQDCVVYHDFRELLARQDIDAICLAIPDHWHVLIGLEAVKRKKDLYFEKPMGLSIQQAKVMRDAVKKYGVVFQFGTQQRSDDRFRYTCELVRNQKIGELQSIMIGSANYKPIPNQPNQPVPPGFDYDFWLGPAPVASYTYERCTRNWTLIRDYSLGCVSGAWGIHQVDIAQWANNSDDFYPITIEGTGTFPNEGLYDTAIAWEVEHVYPNGVKLIHMDMPTALTRAEQFKLFWMGVLFTGTEGWIYVSRESLKVHPNSLLKGAIRGKDIQLPRSHDHRRNFLDAVKSRLTPISHIDAATRADIICHHADIAMQLKRRLNWDSEKEEFVNDLEANRLMSRAMRSPWHL
jgi:hypothetical protein